MNLEPITPELIMFAFIIAMCALFPVFVFLEYALQKHSNKREANRIAAIKARHAKEDAKHAAYMASTRKLLAKYNQQNAAMRKTLASVKG